MITPEERQGIIDEAIEKTVEKILLILPGIIDKAKEELFLILPETIGSLLTDHIAMSKITSDFYEKYPEFRDHKDAVMSVIEAVDGKNPLLDYKDKLKKAVPEIRERIKTVEKLNMTSVSSNPSRAYEPLPTPKIENPHGEL